MLSRPLAAHEIHLCYVMPLAPIRAMPTVASSAHIYLQSYDKKAHERERKKGSMLLRQLERSLLYICVPKGCIYLHLLAPASGAADIGYSILKCGERCKAELIVLGNRGIGSFKR